MSMWRRVQILSPVNSLIVASLSASALAIPLAVQSIPNNETALLRNFLWPDTFTPYITFSMVFIGVVPVLLGYYHFGRLGLFLNIAGGFALAWVMLVCAIFCFLRVGNWSGSVRLATVAYTACVALTCIGVAWLHFKASRSAFVRDAQRKLRLLPTGRF